MKRKTLKEYRDYATAKKIYKSHGFDFDSSNMFLLANKIAKTKKYRIMNKQYKILKEAIANGLKTKLISSIFWDDMNIPTHAKPIYPDIENFENSDLTFLILNYYNNKSGYGKVKNALNKLSHYLKIDKITLIYFIGGKDGDLRWYNCEKSIEYGLKSLVAGSLVDYRHTTSNYLGRAMRCGN